MADVRSEANVVGGSTRSGKTPNERHSNGPAPIEVDASQANVTYANFCRITGTPEEVFIDFGLNHQPYGTQPTTVPATQRIVTNYYMAKRLVQILGVTVKQYEDTFGALETNVQRRVLREAPRTTPAP